MKLRSFFLSALFATVLISSVSAQGFHLGIKGGANIMKIDGQSFDQQFKFGYSVGGFAEINVNKTWGIQPEVLWNQSRTTTAQSFNQIYNGIVGQEVILNYLSIPILLSIRPIPLISFQVGPQYGILINQNSNLFENGQNAFKKGDFSLLGGAQLNLGGFKAGARYYIGLSNIDQVGNRDQWKNQGFQLYIGLRII